MDSFLGLLKFLEFFGDTATLSPFIAPEYVTDSGDPIVFSAATQLHSSLIRACIQESQEFCLLTTPQQTEFLHLLSLDVLLGKCTGVDGRDAVVVYCSDTAVRERFSRLGVALPANLTRTDSASYPESKVPIANIATDGSLTQIRDSEQDPRFIFSYWSTRVPADEVGRRTRCVFIDDSVKFEQDRIDRIRGWCRRNGVPSIVYLTTDPVGPLCEYVRDDCLVWAPSDEVHEAVLRADETRLSEVSDIPSTETTTAARRRFGYRRHAVCGIDREVHVCGGEALDELFGTANQARFRIDSLAEEIDAEPLWEARSLIRHTLQQFRELLTPLAISERHQTGRTIEAFLSAVEDQAETVQFHPEAGAAVGTLRAAYDDLHEMYENWDDIPIAQTKAGELTAILYDFCGESDSAIVVAPTDDARRAFVDYLTAEHSELDEYRGDGLQIRTPETVDSADPADHVVLYGAPRYEHRSLLRTQTAQHMLVLTYPIEHPLLQYQTNSLSEAIKATAGQSAWDAVKQAPGMPSVGFEELSAETVSLTVPDIDERRKSKYASSAELRDDEEDAEDLDTLIREYEFDLDSESGDVQDVLERVAGQSRSERDTTVEGCLRFDFDNGRRIYLRLDADVSLVKGDGDAVVTKSAAEIKPGEVMIHLQETETIREKLYELIRRRGDARMYVMANLWRTNLRSALEETGDSLDEFITKVERHLDEEDHMIHSTYRDWYELDRQRTRSPDSLWAIVQAYDLTEVEENFQRVWEAAFEMEDIYSDLKDKLREHALNTVTGDVEDMLVSEEPNIRLSDFELDRYVNTLTVRDIQRDQTVPRHKLGKLQ